MQNQTISDLINYIKSSTIISKHKEAGWGIWNVQLASSIHYATFRFRARSSKLHCFLYLLLFCAAFNCPILGNNITHIYWFSNSVSVSYFKSAATVFTVIRSGRQEYKWAKLKQMSTCISMVAFRLRQNVNRLGGILIKINRINSLFRCHSFAVKSRFAHMHFKRTIPFWYV